MPSRIPRIGRCCSEVSCRRAVNVGTGNTTYERGSRMSRLQCRIRLSDRGHFRTVRHYAAWQSLLNTPHAVRSATSSRRRRRSAAQRGKQVLWGLSLKGLPRRLDSPVRDIIAAGRCCSSAMCFESTCTSADGRRELKLSIVDECLRRERVRAKLIVLSTSTY